MDVPARVEIEGGFVTLTWEDGLTTKLTAARLRAACSCASCREPEGMKLTRQVLDGTEPIRITDSSLVGGYAINFVFTPDGHHTGIFPFDALRSLGEGD